MSETATVVMYGPTAGRPHHRPTRNRVSAVKKCATCKGNRNLGTFEDCAGFCRDCLDRSRIVVDDDIGGES